MSAPATRTVEAAGVTWELLDVGRGPVVLLVHGFPLDHTMWSALVEPLARRHRVLAPDLPGFGASAAHADLARRGADADADDAPPPVLTMERLADDLAALLDALDVRAPVTYCGLSMGGYVAWPFVARHGARVRRLVLCDTRAAADDAPAAQVRFETAQRMLCTGAAPLVDAMLPRLFAPDLLAAGAACVEATRQVMLRTAPATLAAALRGMARRPDHTGTLARIDAPALVICGEHDLISPPDEMRAIAAALPRGRYVEVPGTGHMTPLEAPGVVLAALEEFLAVSSPARPAGP